MKFDIEKIIEEAAAPENDRKSQSFFISMSKVGWFKRCCDKIGLSNSRVLEVFMQQFSEHIDPKGSLRDDAEKKKKS